jgi:hypothetical protein
LLTADHREMIHSLLRHPGEGRCRIHIICGPTSHARIDHSITVIPAKAGIYRWTERIHRLESHHADGWFPAFAGMTIGEKRSLIRERNASRLQNVLCRRHPNYRE